MQWHIGILNTDAEREVLVAHEMGHIFGAEHDKSGCDLLNGPIMCPSITNACTWNCSPHWSTASHKAINLLMLSPLPIQRFRNREFNVNTPTIYGTSLKYSGNEMHFSGTYSTGKYLSNPPGSWTFTGGDSVILGPGFQASITSVGGYNGGPIIATTGPCDPFGDFAPTVAKAAESESLQKNNGNVIADISIKAFPNPFVGFTTLEIDLPKLSNVSVTVYNALGQLVDKPYENRPMNAGVSMIHYEGKKLKSGSYMFVIEINEKQYIQKMIKM